MIRQVLARREGFREDELEKSVAALLRDRGDREKWHEVLKYETTMPL